MIEKEAFREKLKVLRKHLSTKRRQEASLRLQETLSPLLEHFPLVVSFVSLPTEIDMSLINSALLKQKKLLLPKAEQGSLEIYQVFDLKTLKRSSFGMLEPDPQHSLLMPSSSFSCILVPGLGFDLKKTRLGFGKGHYDRFLKNTTAIKIGIGFKEQLVNELPQEPHDVSLNLLFLR